MNNEFAGIFCFGFCLAAQYAARCWLFEIFRAQIRFLEDELLDGRAGAKQQQDSRKLMSSPSRSGGILN
jgi:hypothetical protein